MKFELQMNIPNIYASLIIFVIVQFIGAISSIHTLIQPADLYSNTTLVEKPKLSSITQFKRIPQSRLGEGGPEVSGNNSIADDPLIRISTSTSRVDQSAILAQLPEYQLLESTRRAFVGARASMVATNGSGAVSSLSSTSSSSEHTAQQFAALEQMNRELEAKLAAMMSAQATPVQPVATASDVTAALSGLRSAGTKRRKA